MGGQAPHTPDIRLSRKDRGTKNKKNIKEKQNKTKQYKKDLEKREKYR
jgi:hypothetical protein